MLRKAVSFLLVLSSLSVAQEFRCDYTFYNEVDGWLKFHEIPANWYDARLRCHLEGAILASPVNGIKETMLAILQNTTRSIIHTGIHSFFTKGDYASIEGVPLRQIPHQWAYGEPDNYKDTENCIAMTSYGKLADVNCADTFSYMCYKKNHHYMKNVCGTIDPGYILDPRTGSCYKFHNELRTWSSAYKACMAEGGYLTIINSEIESQVIKDILDRNPASSIPVNYHNKDYTGQVFVGFRAWDRDVEWLTIHGQSLADAGFSRFADGEPNNETNDEYCGAVFRSGLLNDMSCSGYLPFICEKSPDSLEDCAGTNTRNELRKSVVVTSPTTRH